MCIIAVANQKGGTGKTTTCVNLGIGLARAGKKVLLVDADAQGSMAVSLGVREPDNLDHTIVNIMEKVINDEDIADNEGIMHHEEGDINYMVLPDMNAGNGYLQIAYATADAPKLKAWYELYQKTMLSSGTPVENMKEISWEEYLKTTDQVPSSERAAQLLQKTKQTEAKEATKNKIKEAGKTVPLP